jgi:hypothetical protein
MLGHPDGRLHICDQCHHCCKRGRQQRCVAVNALSSRLGHAQCARLRSSTGVAPSHCDRWMLTGPSGSSRIRCKRTALLDRLLHAKSSVAASTLDTQIFPLSDLHCSTCHMLIGPHQLTNLTSGSLSLEQRAQSPRCQQAADQVDSSMWLGTTQQLAKVCCC